MQTSAVSKLRASGNVGMWVPTSKYNHACQVAKSWHDAYHNLLAEYNKLVELINAKGGEAFLNSSSQFTPEQIDRLIRLCHPDKHGNSEAANEMTAALLKIRGK